MPQAMVTVRMDPELKRSMEQVCQELGLSMSTAFTIFAKKMAREHRIPFEVSADPFYSPCKPRPPPPRHRRPQRRSRHRA